MRTMIVFAIALAAGSIISASGRPPVVVLPEGVTRLVDIGAYRLAYQLDGADVVDMPLGWSGHYTPDVGIAFTPLGVQEGKPALLLHCPWRKGPGITFAEYRLFLPEVKPLRFRASIAMWMQRSQPGDGVTFRISVSDGGPTHKLLDEHYASNSWKDLDFDLSAFAGKTAMLHLEVDPGPERNTGWDYSLWGDARIVAGGEQPLSKRLAEVMRKRARWPAPASLLGLANDRTIACRPSVAREYTNKVTWSRNAFVFEYRGADCVVRFILPRNDPRPSNIVARVDDLPPVPVCIGEGFEFPGGAACEARIASANLKGGEVVIARRCQAQGLDVITRLRIEGKSLVIVSETEKGGPEQYHLGKVGPVPFRRSVSLPYLSDVEIQYLPDQCVFVSTFFDWVKTNASYHDGTAAYYQPLTDGTRNRISQIGYVTVSPDLREVLPNNPYPPSPFLKMLASRVMLDIWGRTYDENAALLRELRYYGVSDAAIIHHAWQRGGYDNELPTTLPANAALGGEEAMKRYSAEARRAGHLFSLHENYVDFYPNSELYTEADVARNSDGSLVKGWFNGGTRIQSFATRPTAMLKYARIFSEEIHRRYGTTAAYLDVHSCVPPWFHVDQQAGVRGAGTCSVVREEQEKLFAYERKAHGGPLFGEGNRQFYWAGIVDGVEAQVEGGEFAPLLLDFDLLKIHPQMVNHGMGYYERWLKEGYAGGWWSRVPSQARMDRYRSTEIAFGHAGFIGNPLLDKPEYAVKEHHLVGAVQALYGAAKATTIEYEIAGKMVDVSVAAALDVFDRAHIRYESGLDVWVNRSERAWRVRKHAIPRDGFLALAPGLTAGTLNIGGQVADLCEGKSWVYADARSFVRLPGVARRRIRPAVESFESLGARKFRIAYSWDIGDALDRDYHVFVHFDPAGKQGEQIAFQQDHAPPKPTSQWKKGDTLIDGPYEATVPHDAPGSVFQVTIGLFLPGVPRMPMLGKLDSTDRIILGTITVAPDGAISFEAETGGDDQMKRENLPYLDHMNAEGRMVDFGSVSTNGAVYVRGKGGAVEIVPVPHDSPFEVSLPLSRWGRGAGELEVRAVDVEGRDLGKVEAPVKGGNLSLRVGRPGAARYLIMSAG